jgi:hypothetical protein
MKKEVVCSLETSVNFCQDPHRVVAPVKKKEENRVNYFDARMATNESL